MYRKENLGSKPKDYVKYVIKECNFKKPPIWGKIVTDYLGLKVVEFSFPNITDYPVALELKNNIPSWIQRCPKPTIFINKNLKLEKKRFCIFHECGHYILPWHEGDSSEYSHKGLWKIEKEADRCAYEFLMPEVMFVDDILSLNSGIPGFNSIKILSSRYKASFSATAIRYALVNPGICAIMMAEPTGRNGSCPLKIKYFFDSKKFSGFKSMGSYIEENSPIFEAWHSGQTIQGEIPAKEFNSSKDWVYNAECVSLRNNKVITLLWLP